jgi:hypothetical protein
LGALVQTAAVFVDAGYLFRAGADTIVRRAVARRDVALTDPQGLVDVILRRVSELWDGETLRLLRTYWYDGARDGIPSPSQVEIGKLPRVKLRLGRVNSGGQKGVDGLIILDLITLARNAAADVVIVVTGDEDIREALADVQGFGVTGVVVGFPPTGRNGQSALLLREADHVVSLRADEIQNLFVVSEGAGADRGATRPGASAAEPKTPEAQANPAETERTVGDNQARSEPTTVEATLLSDEAAEDGLRAVCRGVVADERFAATGIFESGSGRRMTKRANKVLVARIVELTGDFPVDPEILSRARQICREVARELGAGQEQPETFDR